jgi:2-C-methyl-D-erythritol 4-phosphate cytidylyltransferase
MARAAALVVATGTAPPGRFNPAVAEVRGRPLYAWSMDHLAAAPAISETQVLLPARAVARFHRVARVSGWRGVAACAVAPATTSPFGALLAMLDELDDAIERILVHDATYPLRDASAQDAVLAAGSATRLAIAATPVKDTLKLVDGHGLVRGTPPRDRLWQVQSPILAPRALLERRLRELAQAATGRTTGWLRALCAGLPSHVVPIGADVPHMHTRADALALVELMGEPRLRP